MQNCLQAKNPRRLLLMTKSTPAKQGLFLFSLSDWQSRGRRPADVPEDSRCLSVAASRNSYPSRDWNEPSHRPRNVTTAEINTWLGPFLLALTAGFVRRRPAMKKNVLANSVSIFARETRWELAEGKLPAFSFAFAVSWWLESKAENAGRPCWAATQIKGKAQTKAASGHSGGIVESIRLHLGTKKHLILKLFFPLLFMATQNKHAVSPKIEPVEARFNCIYVEDSFTRVIGLRQDILPIALLSCADTMRNFLRNWPTSKQYAKPGTIFEILKSSFLVEWIVFFPGINAQPMSSFCQ